MKEREGERKERNEKKEARKEIKEKEGGQKENKRKGGWDYKIIDYLGRKNKKGKDGWANIQGKKRSLQRKRMFEKGK